MFTHRVQRLAWLLLFTTLGGCAGVSRAPDGLAVPPRPGHALLIGSVTAPAAGPYHASARFDLLAGDGRRHGIRSASPTSSVFGLDSIALEPGGSAPDAGLEAELGRLFVLEVPAGDYRLEYSRAASRAIRGNRYEPLHLGVREGEAVYIGNLDVRNCIYDGEGQRVYRGFVADGLPRVNDHSARDLALLRQRWSALGAAQIAIRLPDDSAWSVMECPAGTATQAR